MDGFDYVNQRLFERSEAERKQFISDRVHWPIVDTVNDRELADLTEDKWACTKVLADAGIPVLPVTAMVNVADDLEDTVCLNSPEQFASFLADAALPLFAKPNLLLGSFGAFRIESFDGETVKLNTGAETTIPILMKTVMADIPYVLQQVAENHADIAKHTPNFATVRTLNMVENGEVRLAAAVFKIPVGDHIADNAWREGNLVADLDPVTGELRRVTQGKGIDLVIHETHPDSGLKLLGETVPMWDAVLDLNEQTALRFDGLAYQSQDIGITDAGPIVVEVNSGGGFMLPQQASGTGFLTDENKAFFERAGVNFKKLKPRG